MWRRLAELRPEWLTLGARRFQMGVEFDCPRHRFHEGPRCRLRFWFANPADGEVPASPSVVDAELYPRLVYRIGGTLATLTMTPVGARDEEPLAVYMHWEGHVVDGRVYDSLSVRW